MEQQINVRRASNGFILLTVEGPESKETVATTYNQMMAMVAKFFNDYNVAFVDNVENIQR